MKNFLRRYLLSERGQFLLPVLPWISAGFSVLQGFAGFRSGQQNAAYAEVQAKNAALQGKEEAARQRRVNAYEQRKFRAELGATGTVGDVSPMLAYLENVNQGELSAEDKIYQGKLSKFGYEEQAANYQS